MDAVSRHRQGSRWLHIGIAALLCLTGQGVAAAERTGARPDRVVPDQLLCQNAFAAEERSAGVPPQLLRAIGLVESGRADPATGRTTSWPWTINVAGVGYFYPSRSEAVAAVMQFRAAGVQSIDVGCLQVNLLHHPAAFASLDQAFNPQTNVKYGASFLAALYRETGNWPLATAAYHSRTPELGQKYARRVMASWPLADRYGVLPEIGRKGAGLPDLRAYTPEFASRLRQAAADRVARDAAMRGLAGRSQLAGAGRGR